MNLHKNRRKRVMPLWKTIVRALNGGRSVEDVRKMFLNPNTGKPYSAKHIWWIRKQLEQ